MRYFILLFFLSFCQQQTISVDDRKVFSTYIQKGYTLLDVRTPDEFNKGHIEGAENFNYFQNNFIERLNIFDKKVVRDASVLLSHELFLQLFESSLNNRLTKSCKNRR